MHGSKGYLDGRELRNEIVILGCLQHLANFHLCLLFAYFHPLQVPILPEDPAVAIPAHLSWKWASPTGTDQITLIAIELKSCVLTTLLNNFQKTRKRRKYLLVATAS